MIATIVVFFVVFIGLLILAALGALVFVAFESSIVLGFIVLAGIIASIVAIWTAIAARD